MAIKGMVEDKLEIKSSAKDFHDFCNGKPHLLAFVSPLKMHDFTLQSADLGSTGSTIERHYAYEEEKRSTKCAVEVDDGKYKVRYKIVGGILSEEFTDIHATYDAIPKPEEGGTIIRWMVEYEKVDDENTRSRLYFLPRKPLWPYQKD